MFRYHIRNLKSFKLNQFINVIGIMSNLINILGENIKYSLSKLILVIDIKLINLFYIKNPSFYNEGFSNIIY